MSMSAHISTYTHLDKYVESRGKEDGRGNKDTYTFAKRILYKGIQVYTNISTHTHTRPQVVLVYIYTYRVFNETHYCSTENEKRLIYFQSLNEINRKIAF